MSKGYTAQKGRATFQPCCTSPQANSINIGIEKIESQFAVNRYLCEGSLFTVDGDPILH